MKNFEINIRLEKGEFLVFVDVNKAQYVIPVEDLCQWMKFECDKEVEVSQFVLASEGIQKRYIKKFLTSIADAKKGTIVMALVKPDECFDVGLANHLRMVGWIKEIPEPEFTKLIKICQN